MAQCFRDQTCPLQTTPGPGRARAGPRPTGALTRRRSRARAMRVSECSARCYG